MTYNLRSYGERAVEIGAKVGAGFGLAGGVLLALSCDGLRAEGDISVGYIMLGLGISGGVIGGIVGAAIGSGLETLTERLYHSDRLTKDL